MNSRMLKILGVVVVVLVAALLFMERDDDTAEGEQALFPDLRSAVEGIDTVTVSRNGEDDFVIRKSADGWVAGDRDDYPADVAKVRALLLAMTDAKIVETKTANPEMFGRLGVNDPEDDMSEGVRIVAGGGDADYGIILGKAAQSGFRYARRQDEGQAWLIDQDVDIPATAGEWLSPQLIDIDGARVRAVTITHADEETIRIRKESEDDIDFEVVDVPEGRELSYATVANGIAGALNDLELDDVREGTALSDAVLTEFETFDGLTVLIRTAKVDEENWISVNAAGDEAVAEEAAAINARVEGWHYRIADYKADLLTRRWEDMLKPLE